MAAVAVQVELPSHRPEQGEQTLSVDMEIGQLQGFEKGTEISPFPYEPLGHAETQRLVVLSRNLVELLGGE